MQTSLLLPLTLLAAAAAGVTNAFVLNGIYWGSSTTRNSPNATQPTPNYTYPPHFQTSTASGEDHTLTANTNLAVEITTEEGSTFTTETFDTPDKHDTYPPHFQTSTASGEDHTLTANTNLAVEITTEEGSTFTTETFYTPDKHDTTTDAGGSSSSSSSGGGGGGAESSVHWPTLTSPGYFTDYDGNGYGDTSTAQEDTFTTTPPLPSASTYEVPETTGTGWNNACQFTGPLKEQVQVVYNFTQSQDFRLLSENQQLFVYEVLAAAEGCQLSQFLSVPIIQRFLLLTQDLPLRFVNKFIVFLFKSLAAEGIRVPV